MKKIWLLTTLLMRWLLLTGCSFHVNVNDTSSTDESNETASYNLNNDAGRLLACNDRVGFYLNTESFNAEWDVEQEAWASFVLNWHVTREENWDVAEDDVECVIDMVDWSVNVEFSNHTYNWELQETWNDEYNQFLENIKSSWEQAQRINDYPEDETVEIQADMPVAKMRVVEWQTEEETQAMVEEVCSNMWWNWVDGGCVLEDGSVVNF